MGRYSNANIIKDSNGKRRIGTWIVSIPSATTDDIYIQVTSPDRLDIIASKLYGDQYEWPIIAAANDLGKGSLIVPANTILRIPSVNLTTSFINTLNEQR